MQHLFVTCNSFYPLQNNLPSHDDWSLYKWRLVKTFVNATFNIDSNRFATKVAFVVVEKVASENWVLKKFF